MSERAGGRGREEGGKDVKSNQGIPSLISVCVNLSLQSILFLPETS